MSGCEATDEVKSIIRQMARAKLEEGFTDHEDIVDAIHAAINEHTPLWKNEIADIISGYGQKRERVPTRTELQERILQLKRDLREAYHPKPAPKGKPAPKSADEVANQRRQTQIKNEIAKIQERLRTGNFEKPTRTKPNYDATTRRMQAELEVARRQADRELLRLQRQNRSQAAKIGSLILAIHRAAILSGPGTILHLTSAALSRLVFAPIEEAAGAAIFRLPGMRSISEKAPVEGMHGQGAGLIAGYKYGLSAQTLKDMKDKVLRGISDLQAAHKAPLDADHPILELVGRIHDALKTPAENFAYAKAMVSVAAQQRAALARSGMTTDEIDRAMLDPIMEARASTMAYEAALRAKLQGSNVVTDKYRQLIRGLETAKTSAGNENKTARIMAGVLQYMMPIVKIPTNLVDEVMSYAAGDLRALGAGISHRGKIDAEIADYMMRNLKKGAVGKVLAVTAWLGYKAFGALYDEDRRKRAGEPDYGEIRLGGVTIDKRLLHSPPMEFMQAVALARRVYENELAKAHRKGEPEGKASAAGTATLQASRALADTLPFVEEPAELWKSWKDSSSLGDYAGKQVASNIPQAVQQAAKWMDPEKALKRKPTTFGQEIENALPGLRERVPLQGLKHMSMDAKLDAYDKMSPAERERTGILDSINTSAEHSRSLTDDQRRRIEAINQ